MGKTIALLLASTALLLPKKFVRGLFFPLWQAN